MQLIRSFVAIELEQEMLRKLASVQEELKESIPSGLVRWVDPYGIHLTLKFLGEVPAPKIEQVKRALEKACASHNPFSFSCGGLGCFPNARRPNVIWVGVQDDTGRLEAIQREVEKALAPLGFAPERRPFSPHLTLGRVGRRVGGAERRHIGQVVQSRQVGDLGRVHVKAVSLMRSDLRPTGAVYTCLARFPLGGLQR